MTNPELLEDLGAWSETKATLHAYARVIAAVPRRWLDPHPHWWHISLAVTPNGLQTRPVGLPTGDQVILRLDAQRHSVVVATDGEEIFSAGLGAGLTADELADAIITKLTALGLGGGYDAAKFSDSAPRMYDPSQGGRYFSQIDRIDALLKKHRARLTGERSPVQLWPHGFDITFEWFGGRRVTVPKDGKAVEYPAQLNFGWSPGEPHHPEPYFFANPWPFDVALLDASLPVGARWFDEGWSGSIFPQRELIGDPAAEERLLGYFQRVFEVTSPALQDDSSTG